MKDERKIKVRDLSYMHTSYIHQDMTYMYVYMYVMYIVDLHT